MGILRTWRRLVLNLESQIEIDKTIQDKLNKQDERINALVKFNEIVLEILKEKK